MSCQHEAMAFSDLVKSVRKVGFLTTYTRKGSPLGRARSKTAGSCRGELFVELGVLRQDYRKFVASGAAVGGKDALAHTDQQTGAVITVYGHVGALSRPLRQICRIF